MSFLSFLCKVFLLDWLLGDDEEEKIAQPPKPILWLWSRG